MNQLDNKIYQFILIIDKQNGNAKLCTKSLVWQEISLNGTLNQFVLGHTIDNIEGEFVVIEIHENSILITNDIFGAIPIYLYETTSCIAITNNLNKLSEHTKIDTTINEQKLYEYFIFGYQINGNNSYYNSIKCIQTHFKITHSIGDNQTSINVTNSTIYDTLNEKETSENSIAKILQTETAIGLKGLFGRSAFLLSGGSDSLMGALLCKSITPDTQMESATFGLSQTLDIVVAKNRAKTLIGYSHNEFLIDQLIISPNDYIKHSIAQNGFGTLSSVYYSFFLNYLKESGFSNAIFSDHFECTRKEIPDESFLRERYTTPQTVVNRYIRHLDKYNTYYNAAIVDIKDFYKENEWYKFYFQDRNIRGQSWKMVLCNDIGMVKYNLSNHHYFLKKNYDLVNNQKLFTYESIINQYFNQLNFDEKELNVNTNNLKSIPISPREMIYNQAEFFINLLGNKLADDILSHFKTDLIINDIKNKSIPVNGEWLILRLLNIIIFNLHIKYRIA
jgi:hypothetical protein